MIGEMETKNIVEVESDPHDVRIKLVALMLLAATTIGRWSEMH